MTFKTDLENMACERTTKALRELQETPVYTQADEEEREALKEIAYYMQGLRDGMQLSRELGVCVNG